VSERVCPARQRQVQDAMHRLHYLYVFMYVCTYHTYVCIASTTYTQPPYVTIRQHTSAHVSLRQHT
jgi:hypothetical protein